MYVRTATKLKNVAVADITSLGNDLYQVFLSIGTDGVTGEGNTNHQTYAGNGKLVSVYFVTSEPDLTSGTYLPKDVDYNNPSEGYATSTFIKGYTYEYNFFGYIIPIDIFSNMFDVVDGETQSGATHLGTGEIVVNKQGSNNYSITIDCGDVYATYEGSIDFKKPSTGAETSYFYTENLEEKDNAMQHTIVITDDADRTIAQFVVNTEKDASTLVGTYVYSDPCDMPGQMSGGLELFGMAFGSYYVADNNNYYLSGGTVTIEEHDGMLSIMATDLKSASGAGVSGDKTSLEFNNISKK